VSGAKLRKAITVSTGTVEYPLESMPERPSDFLLGQTWAYLIDLLDAEGEVAFRIHYIDAIAGSDQQVGRRLPCRRQLMWSAWKIMGVTRAKRDLSFQAG